VSDVVQAAAVAVSSVLLVVVLDLVRRRRLREEYSFIWIGCALALLGLSVWRDILHVAARALGVYYPPALLLLLLILFVFIASLYFSVVISRQREEIEALTESIALLDAELRELRGSRRAVASADVIEGAADDRGHAPEKRHLARR
jgi:hypothetical protein